MAPVFQAEARTVQRFIGLPGVTKARLWPTVASILDHARAAHVDIADQIVLGALNSVLIEYIVAGHYFEVHATLGKILGLAPLPEREDRRPLAKAGR